jgi:tetratricopeptide (TPR) repeat protein
VQTYNTAMSQSSPQTNAAAALELVERLCEESHEDWIEGMLLAGCLAYALGDFCKAMHWYQTILVRDSSHVEAMSNLAATLLALNRREEALNYWFAAVKLRPSYFEAVEHLVGLLSNTQRGKEAVNIIEHIEQALRMKSEGEYLRGTETFSESDSDTRSRTSSIATIESQEKPKFEYEDPGRPTSLDMIRNEGQCIGSASRGYNIPASENHRLLGLIHAKGNMLFGLGNHQGAAAAFEEAIMIATCRRQNGIKGLIREILAGFADSQNRGYDGDQRTISKEPVLLFPNSALKTRFMLFPRSGHLPGLEAVEQGQPLNAAIQTTSNSLLSLAKIYQDHLTNVGTSCRSVSCQVHPQRTTLGYFLQLYNKVFLNT